MPSCSPPTCAQHKARCPLAGSSWPLRERQGPLPSLLHSGLAGLAPQGHGQRLCVPEGGHGAQRPLLEPTQGRCSVHADGGRQRPGFRGETGPGPGAAHNAPGRLPALVRLQLPWQPVSVSGRDGHLVLQTGEPRLGDSSRRDHRPGPGGALWAQLMVTTPSDDNPVGRASQRPWMTRLQSGRPRDLPALTASHLQGPRDTQTPGLKPAAVQATQLMTGQRGRGS